MPQTLRFPRPAALAVLLAGGIPALGHAQAADTAVFRLHKFKQAIGEERDAFTRDASGVGATINFRFVDRGAVVALAAAWHGSADLIPQHFEIKGSTSRLSTINDAVDIKDGVATVRTDTTTSTTPARAPFFTIAGYSPVGMHQLLLDYWERHGKPASITVLPAGTVSITRRGIDTVIVDGRREVLQRYGIDGLIWGRETAWRNARSQLVALVTIDAEFDHFEAVREGYEPALGDFISRAASDGAAALAAKTRDALPIGKAAGAFALVGGTLIDGTGAPPLANSIVLVRNGRIVAAGPRASVTLPSDGVTVIDVTGKSVLAGLWDMHAHYEQVEWGPIYLAAGVTTARDVGNEFDFITSVRDAIAAGRGVGPRLLLAGVIDGTGPIALGVEQADTREKGVALVHKYHDAHFQQIKIYSSMKLPVLQAVTAEAHRLGMSVTGHIPEGLSGFDGVNAGMDQINHVQYIVTMMRGPVVNGVRAKFDTASAAAHDAIAFLQAHHTVVDPTLAIFEMSMHPARTPYSDLEPGVLKVAPALRPQLMSTGVPQLAEAMGKSRFEEMLAAVGAMHRAGITMVAGTDQVVPGYSLHREIELYVRAGFTPLEAIQAATIVPARVMGLDGELGTVTVGKRADLIVVSGNPLEHIGDLRKVTMVVANGRRYDPAPLWKSVGFEP